MNIRHIMTQNPVSCDVGTNCRDVAKLMEEYGVGSVVCLRSHRVVGLVTDRQLALRCLAGDEDPSAMRVEDVMTEDPACLGLDDTIFSAVDTFRSAGMVRRLPVVNDRRELVGLVSLSDIAVIAKDLMDAILGDETHHSLNESRLLTGGKRLEKDMRRPRDAGRTARRRNRTNRARSRAV